ncbi:MAG TPA: protein kinase [Leptolinea sp.]
MSNLEPGSLLHERYRIIRPMGKGGMGMVYLADDASLGKSVAVKENYSLGEDGTGQFLQEAHLLAALRHPHLPRVTDYFIVEPYQYLVMDYLPGDDLQTIIEKEGRQPLNKVMGWAEQLADALTYMHSQNPPVIHRDIKPANIKLKADESAVLVDFGIAKAAETDQKTAAGAMGYTPGFAPPEQAGGGRTGPFSDQFALSATLYNLLTGIRPVDSVKRVLEGEKLISARVLNPIIPVNISDVLQKAMALRPADRFENIQAFVTALKEPEFRWSEQSGSLSQSKAKKPAWLLAAYVLIGILVIAILGIAAIAMLKLAVPVSKPISHETSLPTAISTIGIPLEASTPVNENQSAQQATQNMPVETYQPLPTQVLITSGRLLVYSSNRADGKTMQLWTMQVGLNKEGKPFALNTWQITNSAGDKTYAAWAPDGLGILFSAPAADTTKGNGLDIWRIPLDGGQAVDLTNRKGDDLFAAWSPNGKLICFTNINPDNETRQIYLMDAFGNNQQRLSTDSQESQGIWPPDMQTLLYVKTIADNHFFSQRGPKPDYKTPQPYDNNQVTGRFGQVSDPAFSPDGTLLAYTRSKGREHWIGIADYQAKGAIFSLITKTGMDFDPTWSADGKWIAFTSERDGIPQIYVMSSAGLIQTNISRLAAHEMYAAWQP